MRRFGISLLLLVASGAAALVGCSAASTGASSSTTPAAAAAPTTEPTEIVSDAQVTAGLATVRGLAAQVTDALGASDQATAKARAKEMYDAWYGFEAAVRKNEKDLYLQMEDGMADIQAGARDAKVDRVNKGIGDLTEGATAYLGKHP
jgi:hypothetical protein